MRSPLQTCDRHSLVSIHVRKCITQLAGIRVVNAHHTIPVARRKILIVLVKLHVENLGVAVADRHPRRDLSAAVGGLRNPLRTLGDD